MWIIYLNFMLFLKERLHRLQSTLTISTISTTISIIKRKVQAFPLIAIEAASFIKENFKNSFKNKLRKLRRVGSAVTYWPSTNKIREIVSGEVKFLIEFLFSINSIRATLLSTHRINKLGCCDVWCPKRIIKRKIHDGFCVQNI